MSQSLRAIKRFRLRELVHLPKLTPSATAANTVPGISSSSRASGSAPVTPLLNPFIPHKSPTSGRWAPPRYSLRRQAELIKHARASNTLHLLPPGPKMSAAAALREVAAANHGSSSSIGTSSDDGCGLMRKVTSLREEGSGQEENAAWWRKTSVEWTGTVRERGVAGADIGARLYAGKKRMFKGHKWERVRERRAIRTKILLRDMDKRVQRFKRVRGRAPPPSLFVCAHVFFWSCFSPFFGFSTALMANLHRWRGGPTC